MPFLALTQGASAASADPVSAGRIYGFPSWYADSTDTRLEPCLDANDPNCVVLGSPVYDPTVELAFPTNFPDEFFYSVTDSDRLVTPGCPTAAPGSVAADPGRASVRMALEGAFANGDPVEGDQMVFGRIRVSVQGGLCPGQEYTFTHPYGTVTIAADDNGSIKPTAGTVDIGCLPLAGQACDFGQAVQSAMLQGNFLRWDPAIAPAAPAGYLGDGATLHEITGGVNSVFRIEQADGTVVGETNLFTVAGKIAGPLQIAASTSKVNAITTTVPLQDIGGVQQGLVGPDPQPDPASATQPDVITITNVSNSPITLTDLTIVGDNAPRFAVGNNGCRPDGVWVTLAPMSGSCNVVVTMAPTVDDVGLLVATLEVHAVDAAGQAITTWLEGSAQAPKAELQGTAIPVGAAPGISLSTTSVNFGDVRVRTISTPQSITVSNSGDAPLRITSFEFLATDGTALPAAEASAYRKVTDHCTNVFVPALGTCDFSLAFAPMLSQDYAAVLRLHANIVTPEGTSYVTLDILARGTGGIASVSTITDPVGGISPETGFPKWYQDEAGFRVGECIDPNDPMCIVLADPNFDPAQPISARPDFANFPTEYFYYLAETDVLPTPGCPVAGIEPGKLMVRFAQEAAFTGNSGDAVDGEQMVFGRVRLWATGGLCPGTEYTFVHPYGTIDVVADAAGGLRRSPNTSDVGCAPAIGQTCDWAASLASPLAGGFLQQTNHPAGYLGNPAALSTVTGAPYLDDAGQPVNYVKVFEKADPSNVIAESDQFFVMGKLVGPMIVNESSHNFGKVDVGTTSPSATFTFTNDGVRPVQVDAATPYAITGLAAADYSVDEAASTCDESPLLNIGIGGPGDSCTLVVTFSPSVAGARDAQVVLNSNGENSPTPVTLKGVGQLAGVPAISVSRPSVTFTDRAVDTTSESQIIEVSNLGGGAELHVSGVTSDDPNFGVADDGTCGAVAVDDFCTIRVRFAPAAGSEGDHTATLTVASDAGPATVGVTGRAVSTGAGQASGNIDAGFPAWYQDVNGVRLQPCLTTADAACVLLADSFYNPAQPVSFPNNFPFEFFYFIADAEPFTVPAHQCLDGSTAPGGTALYRVATEGTFTGADPATGVPTTFNRVRLDVGGLCALQTYTVTTPFGPLTVRADGAGNVLKADAVVDVPGITGSRPISTGVLSWDPNVAPAAPSGYLGNGVDFHKVVGAWWTKPGDTEPANYIAFEGLHDSAGTLLSAKSDRFLVAGRRAGAVTAIPNAQDFGTRLLTGAAVTRTITFENETYAGVTLSGVDITGPGFTTAGLGACASLPGRSMTTFLVVTSCTVDVTFDPALAGLGVKAGSLVLTYSDGTTKTVTVPVKANVVNGPNATFSVPSVSFPDTVVSTVTAPSGTPVTVTNSGDVPLALSPLSIGIANSSPVNAQGSQFGFGTPGATTLNRANGLCYSGTTAVTSLAPGATCTVFVRFGPSSTGLKTANVAITDSVFGTVRTFGLSGTGVTGPVIKTSLTSAANPLITTLAFANTQVRPSFLLATQITPTGVSATNVVVSNSGGGTVTLSSIGTTGDFEVQRADGTWGTTGGKCANGATNLTTLANTPTVQSCLVPVRFKPSTIGARSGSLVITDTVAGQTRTVTLTGTGLQATVNVSPTAATASAGSRGSSSVTISVTNTGTAPLWGKIALTGARWTISKNSCGGTLTSTQIDLGTTVGLAAGGRCSFSVTFTPAGAATGSVFPATVSFTGTSASNNAVSVSLTGTVK